MAHYKRYLLKSGPQLTLQNKTIRLLQHIVGKENVLTEMEDCYVYSFEQIYRERPEAKIDCIVKTRSPKEIKDLLSLADKECFTVVQREKKISVMNNKSIVLLDDSEPCELGLLEEQEKCIIKNMMEFQGMEQGVLQKLALAQKMIFLNKPTTKHQDPDVCSSYCTVAPYFNNIETWSAKGRLLIIRGILRGDLPISKKIVDILYTCSNCGLCFAECLSHSEFQEAVRSTRQKIGISEYAPKIFKAAAQNILKSGDPSGTSARKHKLLSLNFNSNPSFKEKASTCYWVGCTVAARTPKTVRSVTNILNSAGVDFTFLGNEGCCGYVLLSSGLWEDAKNNAIKLVEEVSKSRTEFIITSCAGCYYTFSKLYPEILGLEMPCAVFHTSQFIESLIKDGRLELETNVNGKVTYHDPCSLGRHTQVYQAPRNVLLKIPDLDFSEMTLSQDRARCCGGGGGVWSYNNRVSLNSAVNRLVKDVIPLDVDFLTTACPTCQINLRYAALRNSYRINVCDFTEIVEAALSKA
jgi:Fe-S oxidoreductase